MERVEQLKSTPSSEDEMDMMTMMMMQLPEFSSPNSEEFLRQPDEEELINLYGAANNNTRPLADLIDNPPAASIPPSSWSNSNSSPFTHLPSTTISFTNNHTPTQILLQPPTLLFPQNNYVNELGANSNYPNYTGHCSSEKRNSSSSSMAAMREMIFRIAAMQPINIDPEAVKAPKRKNVKISKDPQSVAARHRRERISERIRILQRLVPGGTKMDTASMLDEAIHYVKFLKTQVQSLERVGVGVAANNNNSSSSTLAAPPANNSGIVAMSTRSTASAIPTPTPYFSLPT